MNVCRMHIDRIALDESRVLNALRDRAVLCSGNVVCSSCSRYKAPPSFFTSQEERARAVANLELQRACDACVRCVIWLLLVHC